MAAEFQELMFTLECGKRFKLRHKEEEKILKRFIPETENFFKMMESLTKYTHFKKHLWMLRIIKVFHTLSMISILFSSGLIFLEYQKATPEAASLEQAYLIFCATICFLIFVIILTLVIQHTVIRKCMVETKKHLNAVIQDQFPTFPFMLEIEYNLIVRIRPLDYSEGRPILTSGMNYYEYTKDHKPDDTNFYKSSNPFDLDPHEKIFAMDILRDNKMKQAAAKRQARKDRNLKGGSKFGKKKKKFGGGLGGGLAVQKK